MIVVFPGSEDAVRFFLKYGNDTGIFGCYSVVASKTGYTGNTYLKCVVGT